MKYLRNIMSFVFLFFISVPAGVASGERAVELIEIEIAPGDTLSRFAQRYLDEPQRWPELLEYNQIPTGDPDLIYPGDSIFVPVEMVRDEIADFVSVRNRVRMRKGGQTSWQAASIGERLYPDDGIRTSADSSARISYLASASYAMIGENSLVFLTPEPAREEVVSMDVGHLRARDVKVLTDSAVIEPIRGSEYSAKVDEERTTTLSVFRGSVDFISAGEKVTVEEGHASIAEYDAPPSYPEELPPPPDLEGHDPESIESGEHMLATSKMNTSFFSERVRPGRERMGRGESEKMIIQVAGEKGFEEILLEEEIDRADSEEFNHELPDGDYYWRAAFIDSRGIISRFSEPSSFTVNTSPPQIIISEPEDGIELNSRVVTVRGQVVPISRIHINNRSVRVERDGSFLAGVSLGYGENNITIRATDDLERESEKKVTVHSKLIEKQLEQEKDTELFLTLGIISSVLSVAAIILVITQ